MQDDTPEVFPDLRILANALGESEGAGRGRKNVISDLPLLPLVLVDCRFSAVQGWAITYQCTSVRLTSAFPRIAKKTLVAPAMVKRGK